MDAGHFHARALFPAVGSAVLACLLVFPASAGDNVQVVPVYRDKGGNGAWVEIDSAGERMKATPYVAVSEEGLGKLLENPEEKGRLAVPLPRLMRLVERARQAIRDMKRPAPSAPSGPAGKPREKPPGQTDLSAPPVKTDKGILPPDLSYGTAAR